MSTWGADEPLIVKLPGTSTVKAGDEIARSADPGTLHLFDAGGPAIAAGAGGAAGRTTAP